MLYAIRTFPWWAHGGMACKTSGNPDDLQDGREGLGRIGVLCSNCLCFVLDARCYTFSLGDGPGDSCEASWRLLLVFFQMRVGSVTSLDGILERKPQENHFAGAQQGMRE